MSQGRVLSQPVLQPLRVPTSSWVTRSHSWALAPLLPIPRAQASPRSAALEEEASIAHSRTPWHWNPELAAPHSHPEGSSCGGSECKATGHRSQEDRANHRCFPVTPPPPRCSHPSGWLQFNPGSCSQHRLTLRMPPPPGWGSGCFSHLPAAAPSSAAGHMVFFSTFVYQTLGNQR